MLRYKDIVELIFDHYFPKTAKKKLDFIRSETEKRFRKTFILPQAFVNYKFADIPTFVQIHILQVWAVVSFETTTAVVRKREPQNLLQLLNFLPAIFQMAVPTCYLDTGCIFKPVTPHRLFETSAYISLRNRYCSGKASAFVGLSREKDIMIHSPRLNKIFTVRKSILEAEKKNHCETGCHDVVLEALSSRSSFERNLAKITALFFFCEKCCVRALYIYGCRSHLKSDQERQFEIRATNTFGYPFKSQIVLDTDIESDAIFQRDTNTPTFMEENYTGTLTATEKAVVIMNRLNAETFEISDLVRYSMLSRPRKRRLTINTEDDQSSDFEQDVLDSKKLKSCDLTYEEENMDVEDKSSEDWQSETICSSTSEIDTTLNSRLFIFNEDTQHSFLTVNLCILIVIQWFLLMKNI